jgi:hypothetical protein
VLSSFIDFAERESIDPLDHHLVKRPLLQQRTRPKERLIGGRDERE